MTDPNIFIFGCVVTFIFAAGCYLAMREDADRRHQAAAVRDHEDRAGRTG